MSFKRQNKSQLVISLIKSKCKFYCFDVDNKVIFGTRMNKNHQYSKKCLRIQRTVTQNPVIPVCDSVEKFFSPRQAIRKRKPIKQIWNSSRNLMDSYKIRPISIQLNPEENPIPKALSPSIKPSNSQTAMTFKKRKPKNPTKNDKNKEVHLNKKHLTEDTRQSTRKQKSMKEEFKKVEIKRKISLEDFDFIKKIGQGAYSEVFLVSEKHTGFVCALKVLEKKYLRQNDLCNVFSREAKIHHYLDHKNIIKLFGLFDDEEYIYLICEYATNGDLYHAIKEKRKHYDNFNLKEVAKIIKSVCEAVLAMHQDFLMHRDIKPQNIFLSFGNEVKLGDFGWSVYNINKALRNTQCGTPLYLAPELVGQGEYSEAVDVWAIGVLTYQLLTGEMPFEIRTVRDMKKVVSQDIYFDNIETEIARDFAQKILEKQASKRLDIEQILEHPFLELCIEEEQNSITIP